MQMIDRVNLWARTPNTKFCFWVLKVLRRMYKVCSQVVSITYYGVLAWYLVSWWQRSHWSQDCWSRCCELPGPWTNRRRVCANNLCQAWKQSLPLWHVSLWRTDGTAAPPLFSEKQGSAASSFTCFKAWGSSKTLILSCLQHKIHNSVSESLWDPMGHTTSVLPGDDVCAFLFCCKLICFVMDSVHIVWACAPSSRSCIKVTTSFFLSLFSIWIGQKIPQLMQCLIIFIFPCVFAEPP